MFCKLQKAKGDAAAAQMFLEFRGREPKSVRLMEARKGTPRTLAEVGGLVELVLNGTDEFREPPAKVKTINALKLKFYEDDDGDKLLKFDSERIKLAADGDGDLHIVGFYKPLPVGLESGRSYFLACVLGVVYKSDKPHIETGVQEYQHAFAEHGGDFPRLFYKDGYLFFRGGTYSITKNGIEG
jgi:hypothetical protein